MTSVNDSLPTRFGIIGDVHCAAPELEQAIDLLTSKEASVDINLCTGDIVDGIGDANVCVNLLQEADIRTVRGNHDRWVLEHKARKIANADRLEELLPNTVDYLNNLPLTIEFPSPQGTILLCHGVGTNDLDQVWPGSEKLGPQRSERLDQILEENKYRYLINGHIHFRLLLEFTNLTLINPGALKKNLQRGILPGFFILDTKKNQLETYLMDGAGKIIQRANFSLNSDHNRRIWHNSQEFDSNWKIFRLQEHMKSVDPAKNKQNFFSFI